MLLTLGRWSANLCTSLLLLLLSLETIAGDSAETVAGDSRWSQYRVSRWSLGPEQLLRSTAVYTEMIVRSMIRWTLTCRYTTLWLSPTESLSHLALRGPPALSRPALALPRRAQDRPPNRPDPRALPQQLSERAQPTTLPHAPPCASSPPPPISPSPTPHSPPLRCSQQIGIATGRSCQWSGCCRVLWIVVYRWWSRRCGIRT